ncbi:glycoside hydrolase domain-containing protein [Microbacterium sp. gxy059]|uniref:glycoside hydrolase domain-containing protein n=1 Tax=Microbacterium sp. gxy059 TaxID=2957199 RepID=UPI003D962E0D
MTFGRPKALSAAVALALTGALLVGGSAPATAATTTGDPAPAPGELLDLTSFVDPHIGTAVSPTSGFAGNVSPAAKAPFGMVAFGPDMSRTNYNGSGGYLLPADAESGSINFLSMTHLSGTGCPGQGVVGILPRTAPEGVADEDGVPQNAPTFRTASEEASPGAYSVDLDSGVAVELGATTRTGIARFTYPDADAAYLALDTRLNANSNMESTAGRIDPENVELTIGDDGTVLSGTTVAPAFCTPYGTTYTSNVFFYAEVDRALKDQGEAGSAVNDVVDGAAVLQYDVSPDDPTLTLRVGISSVSVENAKENLEVENPSQSLEEVRAAVDEEWNERLNTIQVDLAADPEALSEDQREDLVKFYTSLYRVYGSPTVYSDANGDFRSMEAQDLSVDEVDVAGAVEDRETANVGDYAYTRPDGSTGGYETHYSGLSLWDSYRTHSQLLALLAPDVASEVAQSIVVDAQQCGAFPHWVDASDDSTPMSGDNALPALAGAHAFGARDFDVVTAAAFAKQSAFDPTSSCNGNLSFIDQDEYLVDGYYPLESSANIERYNSDYAAAQLLSAVGEDVRSHASVGVDDADIEALRDRAGMWENILDPETGTIIAREAPTSPGELGEIVEGSFHESTEPNYFWSFGHAWDDLIDAIGGEDAAIDRLDALFSMDGALTAEPTLEQINGGEESPLFYMGNEPSYQAPWAYNWAGKPSAAQYVIGQLRDTGFGTTRDGMPGNDDAGTQSGWFVLASLGLFPVVPSDAGLAIATPLFPAATVWIDGEPLRIMADGDPTRSRFIDSMTVDGHPYGRSWMPLSRLAEAREISYGLSDAPTSWAADVHPTAAAATETTLALSHDEIEAGAPGPVDASIVVASSDETTPIGSVELRRIAQGQDPAEGDVLAAGTLDEDGSTTLEVRVPAGAEEGVWELVAVFAPDDPSFLAESASDPVSVTVRSPEADEPGDDGAGAAEDADDETPGVEDDGSAGDDRADPGDDGLAPTGGEPAWPALVGALLLTAGLGALLLRRARIRRTL